MTVSTKNPDTKELSVKQYAELVNGKVSGLSLVLSLYISFSSSGNRIAEFIKLLEGAENIFDDIDISEESQRTDDGYIDGMLYILRDLQKSLKELNKSKLETDND